MKLVLEPPAVCRFLTVLLFAGLLYATALPTLAQTEKCPPTDTLVAGDRVKCSTPDDDSEDIVVELTDFPIGTTGTTPRNHAVKLSHAGTGDLVVRIGGMGSRITTLGQHSRGVDVDRNTPKEGWKSEITLFDRASIATSGTSAHGINFITQGEHASNRTDIRLDSLSSITTTGKAARGIYAQGNISGNSKSDGDLHISLNNGARIRTEGEEAVGIEADKEDGNGDISVSLNNGASVITEGKYAYGIYIRNRGDNNTGKISIRLDNGSHVRTSGRSAHGIYAQHASGEDIRVHVSRGSSVIAEGNNATGISLGQNSITGANVPTTKINQLVTVDGRVVSGSGAFAAGIFLRGGGRVIIGPTGSISSQDGYAIRSRRQKMNYWEIPVTKPYQSELTVDLALNGRELHEVVSGKIVNGKVGEVADFSRTLISSHGVILFDSRKITLNSDFDHENVQKKYSWSYETSTSPWVPSGAYDIRLSEHFFTPASDEIKVIEKGPTTYGETQKALELNFSEESTDSRIAALSAVYEALPDFLLTLDGDPFSGPKVRLSGSPHWIRFAVAGGSRDPSPSTAAGRHRFTGAAAAIGFDRRLGEGVAGSLVLRTVRGTAKVSAAVGAGKVRANGLGMAGEVEFNGSDGRYAKGQLSLTGYDLDMKASGSGAVTDGSAAAKAKVLTFGVEAGQRVDLDGNTGITTRLWFDRSRASMDGITDTRGSTVSIADGTRLAVGGGIELVEDFDVSGGLLSWRWSLGLEHVLDERTEVVVSGTPLGANLPGTGMLLGLGAGWRTGSTVLAADISVDGIGSGNHTFLASLNMDVRF